MNNSCWFYLEPYVHASINRNHLLLYNSLSGKLIEYKNNGKILNLVNRLVSSKNLFLLKMSKKDLNDPYIASFIKKTREYFLSDLIESSHSSGKPIQIAPILNVYKDMHRRNKESLFALGREVLHSLTECTFYINNHSEQDSPIFKDAYRQFLFSYIGDKKNELELDLIKKILNEAKMSSLYRINILGGNIFGYSRFNELDNLLREIPVIKEYYCYYKDIIEDESRSNSTDTKNDLFFKFNDEDIKLKILIDSPIAEEKFKELLKYLRQFKMSKEFVFVLENEAGLEHTEKLISKFDIIDYSFKPYFNGKNLSFFRKQVFISKKDIVASKPDQKELFRRKVINPLNFGKIFIFSNGNIYANPNKSRLGNIKKDSIYDVVYKEIYKGKSWRCLRINANPCKGCVYKLLCPPLSNYEYVLGRNNLCKIYRKKNQKKEI